MGLRFTSGKWHVAVVVMVAPVLGAGYYAGNPANLDFTVHAALSGAGSVHGRQTLVPGSKSKSMTIAREAEHLFAAPLKGPRADLYMQLTHSRKGLEPEIKIAALRAGADMMTTGSLPSTQRPKAATVVKASRPSAPIDHKVEEFGLPPLIPVVERTTANLFLSSMASAGPIQFPEFLSSPDKNTPPLARSSAISRGLKFKGETENEYQVRQRRCLATAIYFEARGEPTRGQLAVAQVVMNRVRSTLYPDTICGVVFQGQWRRTGCQFSFTCDGRTDIAKDRGKWRKANELAKRVTDGESWLGDIGYATHYHANYVKPRWRREMNRIKQVGRHIFYRVRAEQIDDVLSKSDSSPPVMAFSGSG